MKITFAMGPYFPVPPVLGGGIERVHLALAEEIAARGHEVTMISRAYADFPSEEMQSGVRHLRVKSRDAPKSRIAFRLFDLLYSMRVALMLPRSDITVTNSVFLPTVLTKRRAGKIYVHAGRFPKGQMWLYRNADRVQTVSESVAEAIELQTPALMGKIAIIPYPLAGPLAELLPPDHALRPREKTILYVGRIAEEKGVHYLVEAFIKAASSYLTGYVLRIVGPHEISRGGSGPDYLQRLKDLAAPASSSVLFDGLVADMQNLRNIYETSDIFVYPSLAEQGETFGIAPVEAMAAGCRVLVSDLACFRGYLEPGRNGEVFDHRKAPVESLVSAMTAMIEVSDPQSMRQAAIATAGRFQVGSIADRFLADFERLVHHDKALT